MKRFKKAARALGIAESFEKGFSEQSILSGVVMRGDLIIDGFTFTTLTVGGMDATDKIVEMYQSLGRDDINVIMIGGSIISWFNIVDLSKVYLLTGVPVISVSYEPSEHDIEKCLREYFPRDYMERIRIYRRNGARQAVKLHTGLTVYVRSIGLTLEEAKSILETFTLQGRIPEPIRVARLLSRKLLSFRKSL